MNPEHKRQIAGKLVSGGRCAARAACRQFGLHRSTFAYWANQADDWLSKLKFAESPIYIRKLNTRKQPPA